MKQRHSSKFKESIVQKILMPGGPTIMQLADKTGIHHTSIRNWIKIYVSNSSMKKSKEWNPEEKLNAIIKASTLDPDKLGEFLRANGLYLIEIEQWRQDMINSQKPVGRPKFDPELVELRAKEKEFTRKQN